MRPRSTAVLLVLLSLLGVACASAPPRYDPFRVPRESFHDSLRTVALAPVELPSPIENSDALRARYAQLLQARLEEGGLKVIGPAEVGPVMVAQAAKIGGLYDPVTGHLDESKRKAFLEACGAELRARHGVDGLIRADVRVVEASVSQDHARWDGMSEGAAAGSFWNLFVTHSGTLPALSLVVRLFRPGGELLYANGGGIQLLAHIGGGGDFVPVPTSELLADPERVRGSVSRALDPLLGSGAEAPPATAAAEAN